MDTDFLSRFFTPNGGIDVFALSLAAANNRKHEGEDTFEGLDQTLAHSVSSSRECNDAMPSFEVRYQTRGLYDIIHLLVYCSDFVGDMVTIENTVLCLLKDLGWDPELPRVGAVVHMSGSNEFVNAMTYCVTRQRLPHHGVRLSRDNVEAQEALDHLLKQCTHAVEFTSRRMATQCTTHQSHFSTLAYAHGLSYLKFVLNE
jgi:hypothetical protein